MSGWPPPSDSLAEENGDLAVVIVNYRTAQLTLRCLSALRGEKELIPDLRVLVVDGGSGDGSASELDDAVRHSDYRDWASFLPLPINGGFGWANNQAILTLARQDAPPDFVHLLNPDTAVQKGAVSTLYRFLRSNPRCGAAGSQLLDAEKCPTASAFRFPSPGREFARAAQSERLERLLGIAPPAICADRPIEVDWLTGASVMFRAEALRESGLFDDGFFLYFEEVELMRRLRSAGWTIWHVPQSRVLHVEGASTGVGPASAESLPSYWYKSRRRYFTLSHGRITALAANIATFAGLAAAAFRRAARKRTTGGKLLVRDLAQHGAWPGDDDSRPSVPAWGDPPGKLPAWMKRR